MRALAAAVFIKDRIVSRCIPVTRSMARTLIPSNIRDKTFAAVSGEGVVRSELGSRFGKGDFAEGAAIPLEFAFPVGSETYGLRGGNVGTSWGFSPLACFAESALQ